MLDKLTDREREVFRLIAAAKSNREIAAEMHLSESTIKIHVGRILTNSNCAIASRPSSSPTSPA